MRDARRDNRQAETREARAGAGARFRNPMPRGIALVQVMLVVSIAAVLALAMLSSGVLQVQANANRANAMQADALADSGLNLALYYIENPLAAPARNADGYWPGENNISFGQGVKGTADVLVSRTAANTYEVTATGKVGDGAGNELTHTAKATVRSNKGLTINRALHFNTPNSVAINQNLIVNGSIQAKGALILPSNHSVAGWLYSATSVTNVVGPCQGKQRVAATAITIPSAYTINPYRTYTYNGRTYKAQAVPGRILRNTTLGPTSDNPAGVYYFAPQSGGETLTLAGQVMINGTLVVENAVLNIIDRTNVITAAPGFPGLIASMDVRVLGKDSAGLIPGLVDTIGDLLASLLGGVLGGSPLLSDLTVNGVAWAGGSMVTASDVSDATININGALMFGGAGTVPSAFAGRVRVSYDSSRTVVPDIDTRFPSGPQIVTWSR